MLSKQQCYSTLKQVRDQSLCPPPHAGHQWEGVAHCDLLNRLTAEFKSRGMLPCEYRTDLSRDGADLTAGFVTPVFPGWQKGLLGGCSLVSSNARRVALHFYAGVVEEATGTPLVTAQIPGWRYVKGADVEGGVKAAVDGWCQEVEKAADLWAGLKKSPVSPKEVAALLFTVGRKKILPWARIGRVDHAWQKNGVATRWGLVKAFWQVAAISPAQDQMGQCLMFTQLLTADK